MFQIRIIIPNPVQGIPCGRGYPQIQPELAQAALFLFQPPAILLTDCTHERTVGLLLHNSRFLFRTAGMVYRLRLKALLPSLSTSFAIFMYSSALRLLFLYTSTGLQLS